MVKNTVKIMSFQFGLKKTSITLTVTDIVR